jgi:hypothetical protein
VVILRGLDGVVGRAAELLHALGDHVDENVRIRDDFTGILEVIVAHGRFSD